MYKELHPHPSGGRTRGTQVRSERRRSKSPRMKKKSKFSTKLPLTCSRCSKVSFSNGRDIKFPINTSKLLILLPNKCEISLFRVHFIDAVKVLDLKVMQQIFKKELTEFERGDVAVISVMKNIEKREEVLAEIITLSKQLDDTSLNEDEINEVVDKIEIKLKELRALSIRTVELIVLWRD